MKIYAIKQGAVPNATKDIIRNLILYSWEDCQKFVQGVSNAKFKSFSTIEEANSYLSKNECEKTLSSLDQTSAQAYVDGSYHAGTDQYAYAYLLIQNQVIMHMEAGVGPNRYGNRQIQGELEAALRSMEYCAQKNIQKLVLLFDYIGIMHHCLGTWKRKDISSQEYYQQSNAYRQSLDIEFVHVKGHSDHLYNEIVDNLCKGALGIEYNKAVGRLLSSASVQVKTIDIKEQIQSFVPSDRWNSIVVK